MYRFGIDIGRVIIGEGDGKDDTSFFGENFLDTPPVPGAIEAIQKIVELRSGENTWLVSKCGKRTQERTLAWLEHHNFYILTGVSPNHVRFCRERHQKMPICKELGITHFIDDRLEIHVGLQGVVPHRYLFNPNPREVANFKHRMTTETIVNGWEDIRRLLEI